MPQPSVLGTSRDYTLVDPKQFFHIHVVILVPDVKLGTEWITSNTCSCIIAIRGIYESMLV